MLKQTLRPKWIIKKYLTRSAYLCLVCTLYVFVMPFNISSPISNFQAQSISKLADSNGIDDFSILMSFLIFLDYMCDI